MDWWCYLHSTSYNQPSWPYRECGLAPAVAFIGEVIVGDLTNNGFKMIVIFLETRWQDAGWCPETVQQLWEGKGVLYEEEGIVSS